MSNTIKFQCHIQISSKKLLDEVKGKTLSFMTNSKTIDENGHYPKEQKGYIFVLI